MEVSGVVFHQVPPVSGAVTSSQSTSKPPISGGSVAVGPGAHFSSMTRGVGSRKVRVLERPRKASGVMVYGFCDTGNLEYYRPSVIRCGGGKDKKKGSSCALSTKKKMKLIKGLSKGLSMISELGLSSDPGSQALIDEVQGNMASDAAVVVLKQLEKLRAEEKNMKIMRKQEKFKLKASSKRTDADCESSSSSSESSDSESECGEVVDMECLRKENVGEPAVDEMRPLAKERTTLAILSSPCQEGNMPEASNECKAKEHDHEEGLFSRNNLNKFSSVVDILSSLSTSASDKKVEVCMGNKCKRSGAPALMEAFERAVCAEGSVVGCKCMGKCRNGPNVRILNSVDGNAVEGVDDSVRNTSNPLCIGVGLEDVDAIVANYFRKDKRELGMPATA